MQADLSRLLHLLIDVKVRVWGFIISYPKLCTFLFLLIVLLIYLLCRGVKYRYKRIDLLFTPTERLFFHALKEATADQYHLFGKVRVADVLTPDIKRKHWQGAFNKISSKHFDYVLCNDQLQVVAAIELDDASHQQKVRIKRDQFLNAACRSAHFPLIRFEPQRSYSIKHIRRTLAKQIK